LRDVELIRLIEGKSVPYPLLAKSARSGALPFPYLESARDLTSAILAFFLLPRIPLTISYYLYKLTLMPPLDLDVAFAALADPTRRAILARLAKGEATVMELAEPFEMTQPAISQHLKVLEEAGLVLQRAEGTRRPRRLAKAGVEAMDQWLAMLRKALEKNYDRLDEVLADMQLHKKGERR
jgi:DNA-binding transcriptional ArsR family regulator